MPICIEIQIYILGVPQTWTRGSRPYLWHNDNHNLPNISKDNIWCLTQDLNIIFLLGQVYTGIISATRKDNKTSLTS